MARGPARRALSNGCEWELRAQCEDVEAAQHVGRRRLALVLLERPRVRARHHVPAERVAPGRPRVLRHAVVVPRRAGEVDVPDAGAVPRLDELAVRQPRDAVIPRGGLAGRDRAVPAEAEHVRGAATLEPRQAAQLAPEVQRVDRLLERVGPERWARVDVGAELLRARETRARALRDALDRGDRPEVDRADL